MDLNKHKWHEKLLGKTLLKCSNTPSSNSSDLLLLPSCETSEIIEKSNVLGLYFSFANINSKNDDLTGKLSSLYEKLNGSCENDVKRKPIEIVQIVLWVNNDVYDDFKTSHRERLVGLPWYALPPDEIELKARLSRRYRIKSGVPTLVLLDKDGSTISVSAQDKLSDDPGGSNFPWRPRPVDQVLKDVDLIVCKGCSGGQEQGNLGRTSKNNVQYKDLPDGIRGFYFSANWCPPCRAFTPQLVDMYELVKKREPNFEIIFVSSDRSAESFGTYIEYMPWLAIPFQQSAVRAELAQLYGIRGIPTLLLLDNNGHVITTDARTELAEDPMAQNFPWKPRSVNILTERHAAKLQDFPAVVLFVDGEDTEVHFAESVLTPVADAYYKRHNVNFNVLHEDFLTGAQNENYLQFLVGLEGETSDILRDLIGLDDVVPLLVGVDVPRRRYAVMEYGVELSAESCADFVERFENGALEFVNIDVDRDNDPDVGVVVGKN